MNPLCPHGLPNNSELTKNEEPLRLRLFNLGPVPSKKNNKQISKNWKTGKPFLRTDDEIKKWTDAAIRSLESQLNSAYRTAVQMGTTQCPLCWIASSVPANDSAKHIRKGSYDIFDAPKDQEGAVIMIRNLDNIDATEVATMDWR